MQRKTRIALVASLVLLAVVAAAVTASAVSRSGSGSECKGDPHSDPAGCPSHERLRRHCADHPRDQVCRQAQADHDARRGERIRAYCREHPEDERCQRATP